MTASRGQILLRRRSALDLDACARLARAVHDADGYPPYMPDDDFTRFIDAPEATDAWVATRAAEIVGHVALHSTSSPQVIDLAVCEMGVEANRLVVAARLLVAPDERRHGLGRLLLERAAADAYDRGLQPILDVTTRFRAAVSLYEGLGWQRLGMVSVAFPDGTTIDEYVYAAPRSAPRPP